jgi:hypothetical protein
MEKAILCFCAPDDYGTDHEDKVVFMLFEILQVEVEGKNHDVAVAKFKEKLLTMKAELEGMPRKYPYFYFWEKNPGPGITYNVSAEIIPILKKLDGVPVTAWEWMKMSKEEYLQKAQLAARDGRCLVCGRPTKQKPLCPNHQGAYTKWRVK